MAARLLLQDPRTKQFSQVRFNELTGILSAALQRAMGDYQRTYDAVVRASGSFRSATEQAAASRLKASLLNNTLPRLQRFQAQLDVVRSDPNNAFWDSADYYANFLRQIEAEIGLFQVDANTLQVASDMSFYRALSERARTVLGALYEAGSGVIGPAMWIAKNLPVILVGGAVIFFVVPPALRSIAAYKRGGSSAALDTAAEGIESTRRTVGKGAKLAAKTVLL